MQAAKHFMRAPYLVSDFIGTQFTKEDHQNVHCA